MSVLRIHSSDQRENEMQYKNRPFPCGKLSIMLIDATINCKELETVIEAWSEGKKVYLKYEGDSWENLTISIYNPLMVNDHLITGKNITNDFLKISYELKDEEIPDYMIEEAIDYLKKKRGI